MAYDAAAALAGLASPEMALPAEQVALAFACQRFTRLVAWNEWMGVWRALLFKLFRSQRDLVVKT